MEDHIKHINKFCRLCRKEVTAIYKVASLANTVNFCYRKDQIDINSDDERTQSKVICKVCYTNLKKCEEEMKYLKKNPNSSTKFDYTIPEYAENVTVHTGAFCKCREGLAQETRHDDAGCTPSKVVKLSAEPIESPSDKLSAREV